jgi:hypothetical protein
MVVKLWEAFLKTIFWYHCQCSHCSCNDFRSACKLLSFQNCLITGKSRTITSPVKIVDASKPSHCAFGKVLLDHQWSMCRSDIMQMKPAVSCPLFGMFPSHCIPEVTEDFDIYFFIYRKPFWNKFLAAKTLSVVACSMDRHSHTSTFMPPVNLCFLHCCLTIYFFKHS